MTLVKRLKSSEDLLLLYNKRRVTSLSCYPVLAAVLELSAILIAPFSDIRCKYSSYTLTLRTSNIDVKFNSNHSQQCPSETSYSKVLILKLYLFTSLRFNLSETYSASMMGGHCLGTIKRGRRRIVSLAPP